MKKYIIFFFLCLFVLPLHAQRIIKYVSFYPVPYASHDTKIYVADPQAYADAGLLGEMDPGLIQGDDNKDKSLAVLNASNNSSTDIKGGLLTPENQSDGSASFKAKALTINQRSGGTTTFGETKPNIKAGSTVFPAFIIPTGDTYVHYNNNDGTTNGTAEILSLVSSALPIGTDFAFKTAETNVIANTTAVSGLNKSLSNIADCDCSGISNCKIDPQWMRIKLKGSEECKQYLVCSYNKNNNDFDPTKNSCLDPATVCHKSDDVDKKCYTSSGSCVGMPTYKINGRGLGYCTLSYSGNTYTWRCPCNKYANGNTNELSETKGNIIATANCVDYSGWDNSLSVDWSGCGCDDTENYEWSITQHQCNRIYYHWHCSRGTLGGINTNSCPVMISYPYWPEGRICSPKGKYCKGTYNPEGGRVVVDPRSSETVSFYCECN